MHQERFQRIADAGLLRFGIHADADGHVGIGGTIEVGVANAIVVLDHGHARLRHHRFDESLATAWDDEVEILVHVRQSDNTFAIGERHELNRMRGQSGFFTTCLQGGGDGAVRVNGFGTTAQDGGIP